MKSAIMDVGKLNKVELIAASLIIAQTSTEAATSLGNLSAEDIDTMVAQAVNIAKKIIEQAKV